MVISTLLIATEIASQPSWEPIGPDTISIYSFQNEGNFLFASAAGSDGGMFRSSDLGDTWMEKSTGLPQDMIMQSLTNYDNRLFVSCSFRGIYNSYDTSASWSNSFVGNNMIYIGPISVAPSPWNSIMAGGTRIKGLPGVIVSENGTEWHSINSGLPLDGSVLAMTIRDTTAYVGTLHGIYRLHMHENTWSPSHNGLTGRIETLDFNETYLFAGSFNNGVYRSSDGINWTAINTGLQTGSETFTAFAFHESNIFVSASGNNRGIFYSTNNGDEWIPLNIGLPADADIHTLFVNKGFLFAGTEGKGAYRLNLSELTAVEETNKKEIENVVIVPNPCHGVFTISGLSGTEILHLQIVNLAGQQIFETDQVTEGNNINLTSFPIGIYFLKMLTAKGFYTKTVVVQH